jgi:ribosomal-protein-alanine N-acetyltransferase
MPADQGEIRYVNHTSTLPLKRPTVVAVGQSDHAAGRSRRHRRRPSDKLLSVELRTERLVLRDYRAEDFAAVHAYASDPLVATFLDWGPNEPEDTEEFLKACVIEQQARPRTRYTFAMTEPEGAAFGSVGLVTDGPHHGEMGYLVRPDRWGQGFASEAAAALLRFGHSTLGLHRIQATCRPDNVASARVMEKIGMILEGHLRDHVLIRGRWQDSLLYAAIAPTEFQSPTDPSRRPEQSGQPPR